MHGQAGAKSLTKKFLGLVPVLYPGPLGIGAKEYVATDLAKALHLARPDRLDIIGMIVCRGQIAALLTG